MIKLYGVTRRAIVSIVSATTIVTISKAAHAQSESPRGFDFSALPIFWNTVDTLMTDRVPSERLWSHLFDHPGYRQIERSGQRRQVLRTVMPLVYMPSRASSLDSLLASTATRRRGGLYRRVARHLLEVGERRADLQAYVQKLAEGTLIRDAQHAAREFLPSLDFSAIKTPTVYVLLFEPNGFGGETLALDLLLLMKRGTEDNIAYMGHEFHHAYMRYADQSRSPEDGEATAFVYHSLSALYWEGIASLVDKQRYLDTSWRAELASEEREAADAFAGMYDGSPTSLAQIDSVLAGIAGGRLDPEEAGRELRGSLPWGGHPNGMYMARAITRAFGKDSLLGISDPFTFALRYNEAAARVGAFQFSAETRAYIERLRSEYVN